MPRRKEAAPPERKPRRSRSRAGDAYVLECWEQMLACQLEMATALRTLCEAMSESRDILMMWKRRTMPLDQENNDQLH